MLRAVGITDPVRRAKAYPFEMSGGMCQRVMIAIALAAKPSLLIADEPTTGLDVTTQAVIMDLVNDLAKELGMATIFITHDLALAGQRSARIVVMHAGHVVENAPTERLVRAAAPSLYGGADRGDAGFGGEPRRACRRFPARCPICAAPTCRRAAIPSAARASLPPARSRCRSRRPAPTHIVACWNPLPEREAISAPNSECRMTVLLDVAEVSKVFPVAGGPGRLDAAQAALCRRRRRNLPKVYAVDDVSFVIGKGETVGLVGESGCGKSTLVRALTRLIDVSDGSVKLGKRELSLKPARVFARDRDRARIQMVFQDAGESVNPRFTAFDAIADPLRRLRKLRGKALDRTRRDRGRPMRAAARSC